MTTNHSCDQRLCFGRPLLLGLLCPLFTCFAVPGKKTPFSSKCWSSPLGHWVCHKQNLKFETGSLLGRLLQHNMKLYFSAGSSRRDSSCLLHSQKPHGQTYHWNLNLQCGSLWGWTVFQQDSGRTRSLAISVSFETGGWCLKIVSSEAVDCM